MLLLNLNNHRISSEHNKTPNQLFVEGYMTQSDRSIISPTNSHPASHSQVPLAQAVEVPRVDFEPCATLQQSLASIDPLGFMALICTQQ